VRGRIGYEWLFSAYGGLTIRPTEKQLFIRLINEPHNKPLRLGIMANRVVRDEITFGIHHEGHLIMQILGIQGVGKSTLALKIAKIIQREWKKLGRDVEIYVTFSFAETVRTFRNMNPGDIVVQDEAPALSGVEARTVVQALQNAQAICRYQQISWIFCYPVFISQLVAPTLILEVVGQYRKTKKTLAVAYSRLNRVLGWVIFDVSEVLDDEEFYQWYLRRKEENIRRLQQWGGLMSVEYESEDIEGTVEKVIEAWRNYGSPPIRKVQQVEKFLFLARIRGSNYYRRMIAEIAFDRIQKLMEEAEEEKEELEDKADAEATKISAEGTDFRKYVYDFFMANPKPVGNYSVGEPEWRNFREVIKAIYENYGPNERPTVRELAEYLPFSTYTISRAARHVAYAGVIGDLMERFVYEIHGVEYPGRRPPNEPDFVHPETNIAYSIKSACSFKRSQEFMIPGECAPEIEHARRHGHGFFYIVFGNPIWYSGIKTVKISVDPLPYRITFFDTGLVEVGHKRRRNA